eukprot:3070970-Prymnesium_polylepis.1
MAAAGNQQQLSGPVASVHSFVKMPGLEVASAQGQSQHALWSVLAAIEPKGPHGQCCPAPRGSLRRCTRSAWRSHPD